jgi:hypothetical protein
MHTARVYKWVTVRRWLATNDTGREIGLDWRWLNPEPSTRRRPISRLDAALAASSLRRYA